MSEKYLLNKSNSENSAIVTVGLMSDFLYLMSNEFSGYFLSWMEKTE